MTTIRLTDEQYAGLQAKAQADGMTLEKWIELLGSIKPSEKKRHTPEEAEAGILELQKHVRPGPDGWTAVDYVRRDRACEFGPTVG